MIIKLLFCVKCVHLWMFKALLWSDMNTGMSIIFRHGSKHWDLWDLGFKLFPSFWHYWLIAYCSQQFECWGLLLLYIYAQHSYSSLHGFSTAMFCASDDDYSLNHYRGMWLAKTAIAFGAWTHSRRAVLLCVWMHNDKLQRDYYTQQDYYFQSTFAAAGCWVATRYHLA